MEADKKTAMKRLNQTTQQDNRRCRRRGHMGVMGNRWEQSGTRQDNQAGDLKPGELLFKQEITRQKYRPQMWCEKCDFQMT